VRDNDPREEIVDHLPALRAFALALAHDATLADDLVQDAVEKAWINFERFREGTNLRAWLFTILRNTFYSHHRKRRREVEDVEGAMAARMAIRPAHDGRLQFKDFLAALQTLPVEQSEALILVGALGFTYEEAAETCRVPLGTIKSRANRARLHVASRLGIIDGEPVELTDAQTKAVLSGSERQL
jgi:RNA polymerase sigma-70 factor (ECF subfamily)